ncbi:hypothetical protein FKM82_028141 [Ascaphus truei]
MYFCLHTHMCSCVSALSQADKISHERRLHINCPNLSCEPHSGQPMLPFTLSGQISSAYDQEEFPFFTLTAFPPGFLVHVGGVVSARSVKLLDRIHNPGVECVPL